MNPKILVAVDGSSESMRAAKYVAGMTEGNSKARVTLLHVAGVPPMLLEHGGGDTPAEEQRRNRILEKAESDWSKEERAEVEAYIFGPARDAFRQHENESGPELDTKLLQRPQHDVARSVIEEARKGDYDTIVVGRHGRSRAKDLILGGLSSKVISNIRNRTVWIVE